MKIAITCDLLIEKNHYVEVVEGLCELLPGSKIYCFAYKPEIRGYIEQRQITSTYLSKKINSEIEFFDYSYKIPSLAKNLFVSCEYDLVINISKGFSQGMKTCDRTKVITYLYDLDFENKIRKSFAQKLFFSFVISWVKKTLKKSDMVLVSRPDLLEKIKSFVPNAEVLPPPFKVSDYSLFPKSMFKHSYFLIDAVGLTLEQGYEIAQWMKEWDLDFKFIGKDDHLDKMKADFPRKNFYGTRCSQEHAPVLAGARAFISFNEEEFPKMVVATMACGRPVILSNELKKWVHGTGTFFASFSKGSLKAMIDEVFSNEDLLDGQKIREHILGYQDNKFKERIKQLIASYQ